MYNTFKGIYLKSRPGDEGDTGEITDILYENIQINNASQWAIWIGPQQAAFKGVCSLLCLLYQKLPVRLRLVLLGVILF